MTARRRITRRLDPETMTIEEARQAYGPRPIKRRGMERIAILRPADPALAMALMKAAIAHDDDQLLGRIPLAAGCTYRFMGWWAEMPPGVESRYYVASDGTIVGSVDGGDAAVTESSFQFDDPPS